MFNLTDQQRKDLELIIKAAEALKTLHHQSQLLEILNAPTSKTLMGINPIAYSSRFNAETGANVNASSVSRFTNTRWQDQDSE